MSRKTEVKRITREEWLLVEALRQHGVPAAISSLESAIKTLPAEGSEVLRAMRTALRPDMTISLERMVELGSLTAEDAQYLRSALEGDKNIAVVGPSGSGKTTLLHSLVCASTGVVRVFETTPELDFHGVEGYAEHVEQYYLSNLTFKGTLEQLEGFPGRVVLGELRSTEDMITALTASAYGSPLLFTACVEEEAEVMTTLKNSCTNYLYRQMLPNLELVVVRCKVDDQGNYLFDLDKVVELS